MKGSHLGEFEELVMLIVGYLFPDAYGLAVKNELIEQSGRKIAIGAVHAALNRLEEKGFLQSKLANGTKKRGGRRKKLYEITAAGKAALETSRNLRNRIWNNIPDLAWKNL